MWKRVLFWSMMFGLATVVVLGTTTRSATQQPREGKKEGESAEPPAAPGIKLAANRVTTVTIYPNSALVTREVDVPEGTGPVELTVNPLPPATITGSLFTEGSEGIRVLTTRFRTRA